MRRSLDFCMELPYQPMGDQPLAIETLVKGLHAGQNRLLLKGATGTGKTFTIANVIQQWNRQTLILVHNKTLAAQIWSELKQLFPHNAVEYFVSYYDFYQPEAYLPHRDLYIEKEAQINQEIERMRHSVMASLLERTDVIVVASVSCLYPMSAPEDFSSESFILSLSRQGDFAYTRDQVLRRLVTSHYERNDYEFRQGTFRVRGGTVEIYPASYHNRAVRAQFFGDDLEELQLFHPVTGEVLQSIEQVHLYSAKQFVTKSERVQQAMPLIRQELEEHVSTLREAGRLVEAGRIERRTLHDLEMLEATGFCPGVENYSVYLQNRQRGSRCFNLLDYFTDDFLTVIDESHVTIPQLRTISASDQARKQALIEYGYRLPSVRDNRPPFFEETMAMMPRLIAVSATPGSYEMQLSKVKAEQLIRPTGLVDPVLELRPKDRMFEELLTAIQQTVEKNERVLVTVLTKKSAEALTEALSTNGVRVRYLHADIETVERTEILRGLRAGDFDVLVGINLLREGLDLPEVSLVAILDADQPGFLRSTSALLQTIGRAARNTNGRVLLFADQVTEAIREAWSETEHRRNLQVSYNEKHGIVPRSIVKRIEASVKQMLDEFGSEVADETFWADEEDEKHA